MKIKYTPMDKPTLIEKLETMSATQIAKSIGISKRIVLRWMKTYGLKSNPAVLQKRAAYAGELGKKNLSRVVRYGPDNHAWKGGKKPANFYTRTMRLKYPEKVKARKRLYEAVRSGRLQRGPCEVCGTANVQAHHDDYNKPLEVRWLCATHHTEHHNRLRVSNKQ